MTTEFHHVPSTNRLLDKYESSPQHEILNGDYINLTKHPKPISNSININTNKKSHFMNNSFERGFVTTENINLKPQQHQEFELTERRGGQSFKNRPRTNSTNETATSNLNSSNNNYTTYSPKKKLQHQNNHSGSHDTIASSLKRIISAGKEKLSPSQIFDTNTTTTSSSNNKNSTEYIYRFKANRSMSNNSYTNGSIYAKEIDDFDDDEGVEEEVLLSDEDKNFLNENEKMREAAPTDDAEKTSGDYGPLDSSSSSASSSPTAAPNAQLINHQSIHFNRLNSIDMNTPNIVIMDGKSSLNSINKSPSSKVIKRNDSIRMRHNSSNNLAYANSRNSLSETKSGSKREKLRRAFKKFNRAGSNVSQRKQNFIIVVILCIVNLLNYIDRFTLAGVLLDIQKYFGINDGESGLLQTLFICSYMVLAPLFGYLGDRYSRKWIIIFGISFWSLMTFLGSFVPPDKFWLFAILRSLVGIGEASYSCVAPTIIGDLFVNEVRTKILAVFYLAVPVGSGLGYIVGSNVADAFKDWRWALRMTPPLGLLCVILLIFVVKDPKRGGADGQIVEENDSTMWQDIVYLWKNKTFVWSTLGFTFASFVLGGLSWWVPTYVQYAIYSNNETPEQIPLIFGVVTCFSGLIGVSASSVIASKLRKVVPYADPLVCALGSFLAVPSLFVLILVTRTANRILFWCLAAFAISSMCLSWTIVADILLYAIYPTKRSIASAFNILICHLLGDAGSPYVIGLISDALREGKPDTYYNKFTSLQIALYAGPFFAAVSFACYLFTAIYVVEDRKKVDIMIKKNQKTSINSSNEVINQNSASDLTNINKIDEISPLNNVNIGATNSDQNSLVTENEIITNADIMKSKASRNAYEKNSQQSNTDLESVANSASNLISKN